MEQPALVGATASSATTAPATRAATACAGPLPFARQAAHCRALMRPPRDRARPRRRPLLERVHGAPARPRRSRGGAFARAARSGAAGGRRVRCTGRRSRRSSCPALERYRAGDPAAAVDSFMRGVCGAGYRAPLEAAVPGAFEQAVADADTFFGQELPAVMEWSFDRDAAARISVPALVVLGGDSEPGLPRAPGPAARLAPARGALRAARRDASAAGRAAACDGGGAGGVLRPAPRISTLRPRGVPRRIWDPRPPSG